MKPLPIHEVIEKAKKIKCLITDVDGVLTNGSLFLNEEGKEYKSFHVHDGVGLRLLMSAGIEVAVITTSITPVIEYRMKQLGISLYHTGQLDKRRSYEKIKEGLKFADNEFAYIGDDLPDLAVMRQVGLSVAVADAVRQVKKEADWQTECAGGAGGVRELCDLILSAQNKEDIALAEYLKA